MDLQQENRIDKDKNYKIDFDIRDGLDAKQRSILLAVKFLCDYDYDRIHYEDGFSIEQIKKSLKANKLDSFSDKEIDDATKEMAELKYPLLSINPRQEICITRFFNNMFEGQAGTDYTTDSVLASAFPNLICNGGQGYLPHDIDDAINAVCAFAENRAIIDTEIHKILKDDTDKDLKKIVEAFANHRINVLGRLNRLEYDRFDNLSQTLKYSSPKEIQKLGAHLSIEEYEELKKELVEKIRQHQQAFYCRTARNTESICIIN